jgi:hypothetical protein
MAVNTQKLLPPSKKSSAIVAKKTMVPSKFLGRKEEPQKVPLVIKKLSSEIQSYKEDGVQDDIIEVQVKVISIDKLLKGSVAFDKKQVDDKRKSYEKERASKKEDTLEKKAKKEEPTGKLPSLPKLGFLDWIKNFITNVVLGYFAVRLLEHLPKLKGVLNFAGAAFDFVIDWGGKILNGLVTFIDWGYKAYDATRGFIKNLFGEGGVKQFDQLSSLLNQFLNLAIIAGMAVAGSGIGKGGKGTAAAKPRTGVGEKPRVTTSGGRATGRPDIRNPFRQRPQVTAGTGGTPRFRLPETAPKVTIGSKGVTKFLGKGLARVPIVGGLIDFALNLALGEKPGRAAAKAVGSTAGAALGTLIPIPVAGTILGGILGDIVGGTLYDALMPKSKMAGGGRVSRDGENKSGVGRTVKGAFSKKGKGGKGRRKLAPRKPTDVEFSSPGADIGGEEKLFGLFPNPLKMAQQAIDVINPFKTVENTGKNLGKTDYFGPILAITSKITLGQKPSQQDYERVGMGINLLFAEGINKGQIVGGVAAAFAEGGLVDPKTLEAITSGGDITKWVASTFKDATESNAQRTLREIKENANKKGEVVGPDKSDPTLPTDDEGGAGGMTKGQWGPLLDLIAGKESGGNYEAMYPSTTLKGATKMTIAEVARRATGAVGKYQQLPQYLVGRAKAAGLNVNKDLYSPENQEKIIINVNIKGRGGQKWLENKISDEEFMQGLSQEFASLPNAQGKFYYPGQRSSMTSAKVKEALAKVKKGGYSKDELAKGGDIVSGKSGSYTQLSNNPDAKRGSKLAGELGRFLDSKGLGKWGSGVHQHPEHRPWSPESGHSPGSLHYASKGARAIDIGGYGRSRGYDDQDQILAGIAQFNKMKGVKPVQLLKDGYPGHDNHVHVAYETGGETLDGPHLAMIGEKGKEIVIDNDSTISDPQVKNMLLAINQASNRKSVIDAIRQYAPYDVNFNDEIIVVNDDGNSSYGEYYQDQSSSVVVIDSGGYHDPFESLDMIG